MTWTSQTLLSAIGASLPRDCFTHADMAAATGLTIDQVAAAANNLRRHGFVTSSVKGCHKLTAAGHFAIAGNTSLRAAPKARRPAASAAAIPVCGKKVWNALRLGKKLTIDDIAMRVCDGDERDPRSNISKYLRALYRAGIITAMPLREPARNKGSIRWLLVEDSGPQAPVWRPTRDSVYDPNTETEFTFCADHSAEEAA